MKHIKVKFIDFWKTFEPEKSIFLQILRENYDVELTDDADYIFYSSFDDRICCESNNKAIKIFYTGENETPDFNICDYAMAYDHLTLGDRYFRLPDYYNSDFFRKETELMEHKHEGIEDLASLGKTEFCSFVVSNARATAVRAEMFKAISNYKKVNSGGRYLNNIGGPVDSKIDFEAKHKFSICFDNCKCAGYTTEKIVEAFAARTVPIYWGDPEVCKVFNPKAFVNVMDYDSIDDAIERIKEIDNNDELYISMLREPALISKEDTYANTRQRLKTWLCHIIDQPLNEAHRVGNGFWQDEYYWKRYNYKLSYEQPLKTFIKRLLGKWK